MRALLSCVSSGALPPFEVPSGAPPPFEVPATTPPRFCHCCSSLTPTSLRSWPLNLAITATDKQAYPLNSPSLLPYDRVKRASVTMSLMKDMAAIDAEEGVQPSHYFALLNGKLSLCD